jgi:hypothetical protein
MLQSLSEMHLESHPAWTGYRAFPEPQQRWRCSTSSTELKLDVQFGPLRACLRLLRANSFMTVDNVTREDTLQVSSAAWTSADGVLTWVDVLSAPRGGGVELSAGMQARRTCLFQSFTSVLEPAISILTDGVDVKLCGKREVPRQWSGKANKWELEVYANTLIQLGRALGVNVEAELHRRRREHQRDSNIKTVDTEALWTFIKAKTPHAPATWCDLVFGEADPAKVAMAQSWTNGSMLYHNLQGDQMNWCRHSCVTGMLPSQILAEIRGANMNLVPAVYVDPGWHLAILGRGCGHFSAFPCDWRLLPPPRRPQSCPPGQ